MRIAAQNLDLFARTDLAQGGVEGTLLKWSYAPIHSFGVHLQEQESLLWLEIVGWVIEPDPYAVSIELAI